MYYGRKVFFSLKELMRILDRPEWGYGLCKLGVKRMSYNIVEKLKRINVLVVGDFMVDIYVRGQVTRISPEAPVPIINVTETDYRLGGAGNVANNIVSLGGKPVILTCIGRDQEGAILLDRLNEIDCDMQYIGQYENISTICKIRVVSDNKQFLRIDKGEKNPVLDEYVEYVRRCIDQIFNGIDIVVISDYDKGVISAEFVHIIIQYAKSRNIPTIVDPKGKDYDKYEGATICTPNMEELSVVTGYNAITEENIALCANMLLKKGIQNILITRSDKGMTLITKDNKSHFPIVAKEVVDVTGAGDTVVAMLAIAMGSGLPVNDCCVIANQAASIVVQKFGTATVSLQELKKLNDTDIYSRKLVTINDIISIRDSLQKKGKIIVFTNGCFDLLHAGHLELLQRAKSYGDVLVVGLNSDQSIKRIKGEKRPIVNECDRAVMLSGLECVDYIIIFDGDSPQKLIEAVRPNVLVKGADWIGKKIAGEDFIQSTDGQVKYIQLKEGYSTTNIINKITREYK